MRREIEEVIEKLNEAKTRADEMNIRNVYSLELKKQVVYVFDSIWTGGVTEFENLLGVNPCTINKWKKIIAGHVNVREVKHGKTSVRYAISTKIEAVEQVLDNGKSIAEVSRTMGMNSMSVAKWIKDYQDGLFSLDNVVQVSRKKFRSYDAIIGEITNLEKQLEEKKSEARKALDEEYAEKLKRL